MARCRTISVDVDVYSDEVLSELSDEELLGELKSRSSYGEVGAPKTLAEEALDALKQGRITDAIVALERGLYPKFETTDDCRKAYAKAMGKAA